MTQWLIKTFIKDHENTQDARTRSAYGLLASWVGIICNLILFAVKFLAGLLSGSVAVSADAFNNLSDASSSVISLAGFKMASKPADARHPYGHARYEYLAGLTVSVMILFIGAELLKSSIGKILHPSLVTFSWFSAAILTISVLAKLWLASFNRTLGIRIQSKTLAATAADSRNDVFTTLAVLAASLFSHFAGIELDGIMGLLVALFIFYSGYTLIKETLDPLLGQAPDPKLVAYIKKTILSYPDIIGTHDLMVHDYGPGRQFASAHVEMAAEKDVLESHEIIDTIERDFMEKDNIHLIIHYDPIVTSDHVTTTMYQWISEQIKSIDPALTIHDLRMVHGKAHTNLIFDCVMPHSFSMKEEELKAAIQDMVTQSYPSYRCIITIDASYAAIPR